MASGYLEIVLRTQLGGLLDHRRAYLLQPQAEYNLEAGASGPEGMAMLADPLIRRSGGLRKVRWSLPGRGKRGGLRVIYFWDEPSETFYMLYAYPKNEQEDLTAQQLRVLRRLVSEEFG